MHPSATYRTIILLLAVLVGLSAAATAVAALINPAGPAWFMFGFELCVLLGCAFGVVTCRGRFEAGVPMIWACVAGCVAVASFVGFLSAGRKLFEFGLTPWLLARLGSASLFALVAVFEATRHNARAAWPSLFKGVACVLPVVIVLALWRRGVGASQLAAMHDLARIAIYATLFVLVGGLLAAGVHLVLRGFEAGLSAARASKG